LRDTTRRASNTTAITTAVSTRFEEELLFEDFTDEGTAAPGVFAGREVTEELWKVERPDETGTAGTTNVDDDLLTAFLAVFFADFFTAFLAVFLTAFLTVDFLAVDFFTDFLTAFFAEVFLTAFLAVFFAVFLTATVALLGLYLKYSCKTQ
jgi:hypothetical protein